MATWNLKHIYDPMERDDLIKALREKVEKFKEHRPRLSKDMPEREFLNIIRDDEEISRICSRLSARAGLMLAEDTRDSKRTAHEAHVSQLCTEVGNDTMFFGLWFKDLPDDTASLLIAAAGQYGYMLERVRAFRQYTLGEKEERIISLKDLTGGESLTRVYDIVTNGFKFKVAGRSLTYDEVAKLKMSPKRKTRVNAYDVVFDSYAEHEGVLGEIYRSIVNDFRNENVTIRGFKDPMEPINLGNDLTQEVVDSLLQVIRGNRRLFQKYLRLKADVCGLARFDRYDLYAPYAKIEKRYSFEKSREMVLEVYESFDKQAYDMARRVLTERHVHSDVKSNKQRGAFCHAVTRGMTPYVLLNHTGRLDDVYAMMHEFGHAVHNMAAAGETEFTYVASLPLAETASLFSEMLLTDRLLNDMPQEEQSALLVRMLDNQFASIMRQAYFILFEREAHRRIPDGATTVELDGMYLSGLREQFGRVHVPDVFSHEWKCIQHIYYHPFYCYSYAFGNLLVLSLYRLYKHDPADFTPRYMRLLALGGSKSPKDILSEVGLNVADPGFWQSGFDMIGQEMKLLKSIN